MESMAALTRAHVVRLREGKKPARVGRVHNLVFSPSGRRVIGMLVSRPDVAGMVKREDVFLGIDAVEVRDGVVVATRGDDSFDDAARARLGLDWDRCIIWGGMDVRTAGGRELGHVDDARFDVATGRVECFCIGDGSVATSLVGTKEIDPALVEGYRDGWMVVGDDAVSASLTGGLAGKAGEATARVGARLSENASDAGRMAGEAVDKGARAAGRAIGRLRAGGSFLGGIFDDDDEDD